MDMKLKIGLGLVVLICILLSFVLEASKVDYYDKNNPNVKFTIKSKPNKVDSHLANVFGGAGQMPSGLVREDDTNQVSSEEKAMSRNPLVSRALRRLEREREMRAIAEQAEKESIAESVAALKGERFSAHFSPSMGDRVIFFNTSLTIQNSDISKEPRIAKLLRIAKSGSSDLRKQLLTEIVMEFQAYGLGRAWRESIGHSVPVDVRQGLALPLIIAELDESGETIELLVSLARDYLATDYMFAGNPMQYGEGIRTEFSGTLAIAIEKVLKNILSNKHQENQSETLEEYRIAISELAEHVSSNESEEVRDYLKSTNSELFDMQMGIISAAERWDFVSRSDSKPFMEYLPDWFVPGTFDWLVIAMADRINNEIKGKK